MNALRAAPLPPPPPPPPLSTAIFFIIPRLGEHLRLQLPSTLPYEWNEGTLTHTRAHAHAPFGREMHEHIFSDALRVKVTSSS